LKCFPGTKLEAVGTKKETWEILFKYEEKKTTFFYNNGGQRLE